jgi:hypothetical protein
MKNYERDCCGAFTNSGLRSLEYTQRVVEVEADPAVVSRTVWSDPYPELR